MLILRQLLNRYHIKICKLSGQVIRYKDWYYEDTEDGKPILYEAYHTRKIEEKMKTFDYSEAQKLSCTLEYKDSLRMYEQQYLNETILNKPIYGAKNIEEEKKKEGEDPNVYQV